MAEEPTKFSDLSLACLVALVLLIPSRRSLHILLFAGIGMVAGAGLYLMPDFWWQLASRSLDSALASMSTSMLALISGVAYGIYRLVITHKNEGWEGVKKNLASDGLHAIVFGVCWWILLFSYHLFWKIPREIRAEAKSVSAPSPPRPMVPQIRYSHTPLSPPFHVPPPPAPAPTWTKTSPEPTTISALFAQDFPTTMKLSDEGIGIQWNDTGAIIHVKRQLYLDLAVKEKFVGFYLPSSGPDLTRTPEACVKLVRENAVPQAIEEFSKQKMFFLGLNRGSDSLAFSKKVLIYHDDPMSDRQKDAVAKVFASSSYHVVFMGPDYLAKRVKIWHQQHGGAETSATDRRN
jgi:hypothetical protein